MSLVRRHLTTRPTRPHVTQWWVPSLAVCILLAGCAASPDQAGEDGQKTDAEAIPSVLAFKDCWDGAGRYPIPLDKAREALPEAFEPVNGGPLGDEALLFITAWECQLSPENGTTHTVSEVTTMIVVDPPTEYELTSEGFQSHGFVVDWVTSSEAASAVYEAWDVPHSLDDVSVVLATDTSAARRGHAETETVDGPLILDIVAGGPVQPFGLGTVRVFYTVSHEDGDLLRAVDVMWDGIPNTAFGSGVLSHARYGNLASSDMFHAWPYDWDMVVRDFGLL